MKSKNETFLRRKPVYAALRKLPPFDADLLPVKVGDACDKLRIDADSEEIRLMANKAKKSGWILKFNEGKYEGVACSK